MKKVKVDIEKESKFSDLTATDLRDELVGLIFIEELRKKVSKRTKSDNYMDI